MRPDRALLAVSLALIAASAFVLVQLRNPHSWLARSIDGATALPVATS